jgi:hypothetical protein
VKDQKLAFIFLAPCQNSPVMQGLWLSMGRIDEVWMCRAQVSGELVQSVVSEEDAFNRLSSRDAHVSQ